MFPDGQHSEKDVTEVYVQLRDNELHQSTLASLSDSTLYEAHPGELSHLNGPLVQALKSKKTEIRYQEQAVPDTDDHAPEKVIVSWEEGDEENPHNWTPVST